MDIILRCILLFGMHYLTTAENIYVNEGSTAQLSCNTDRTYPMWDGPEGFYNFLGSAWFNYRLGEKFNRLSWGANKYDLLLSNVSRNDSGSYTCQGTINKNLYVRVPIQSVTMTGLTGSVVTVNENTETVFVCTTSGGLPAATVRWYKDQGTTVTSDDTEITSHATSSTGTSGDLKIITSTLRYSPTRAEIGMRVYCTATNSDSVLLSNRTPKFNVRYSPDSSPNIQDYNNGGSYKMIEGSQGSLSCTIIGGNPLATLTWNCYNTGSATVVDGSTVTKTVTWTASHDTDRLCTCQSSHPVAGTHSVSVYVQVLYSPSSPTFKVQGALVSGPISFIEGKTRVVVCESKGKPDPDTYVWTKGGTTVRNVNTLTFNSVQKQDDGEYICTVQNTMIPSSGAQQTGTNSSTVKITVLYAPTVPSFQYGSVNGVLITMTSIDVLRGDSLKIVCKSDGQPKPNYQWSGQTPDTQILTVTSIQDDQSRTCTATNTLRDTYGVTQQGSASSTLTMNVMYKASVISFAVEGFEGTAPVTVSENDNIPFTCSVDSNPDANMKLQFRGKTLYRKDNTKNLTYIHNNAACIDAGVYTCAADNQYNYGTVTLKELTLYVKCSPRPFYQIKRNFTSPMFVPVTLSFTALAYPEPGRNGFVWQKENGFTWIPLLSNADILVSSSELQTNLTIKNVSQSDYGHYRVTVTNEIGKYDQYLFLTDKESRTDRECNCSVTQQQTSVKSSLIISVTLGLLCAGFASYAIIVTIMLKRRIKNPESQPPANKERENTTYLNLSYRPESGNIQRDVSGHIGSNVDDDQQYTSLERRQNNDQTTYDIIERVQN